MEYDPTWFEIGHSTLASTYIMLGLVVLTYIAGAIVYLFG